MKRKVLQRCPITGEYIEVWLDCGPGKATAHGQHLAYSDTPNTDGLGRKHEKKTP